MFDGTVWLNGTCAHTGRDPTTVHATLDSQVFLRCPVKSHHAQYSWHHGGASTACSVKDQECLLLIDRVGAKHEKVYECLAEESGYKKTVKLFQLKVQSRSAGLSLSPLPWVLLMTLIISTLFSCKVSVWLSKQIFRALGFFAKFAETSCVCWLWRSELKI